MKPEASKAFRLFSFFTLKDLRSHAMGSGKGCHFPGALGGIFGAWQENSGGTLSIHSTGGAMRSS